MFQLLWFLALCLHQILIGNSQNSIDCSEGFIKYEGTRICVTTVQQSKGQLGLTCSQREATLFSSKMSDSMFEKFRKDLKKVADRTVAMEAYVGMKKIQSFDSDKSWEFSNNEGSIKEKSYEFWSRNPRNDEDCAVMVGTTDYKITPYKCSQTAIGLCERSEEPCYHQNMLYSEYYGRCISPTPQKADYDTVTRMCYGGYTIPITDTDRQDSAAAALYATPAPIYAGLIKNDVGKWVYETGGEEEDEGRFAGGAPGKMDCGVYALNKDGKLEIFTSSCEGQLRGICEIKDSLTGNQIKIYALGN